MDASDRRELTDFLRPMISEERLQRIEDVLHRRTRRITVVLEDIYQPHNASAVIRTCDCFGIQDLHIIENKNKYNINPDVALGSAQWITLHRWRGKNDNTGDCLQKLKAEGYTLYATSPHGADLLLEEIPVTGKTAMLFGTEAEGLSEAALALADHRVRIPMEGFTESFNISVSAALCLYQLRTHLNVLQGWELSDEEMEILRLNWYRKSIRRVNKIEEEFFRRKG